MATNVDQVKRYVEIVVSAAAWIQKMIPGQADDKAIEALTKLASQPWFAEFACYILNLFEDGKEPSLAELNLALTQFVPTKIGPVN